MSGNQWASALVMIGCLVLVGSSLVARRLPGSKLLGLAATWAGIFLIAAAIACAIA